MLTEQKKKGTQKELNFEASFFPFCTILAYAEYTKKKNEFFFFLFKLSNSSSILPSMLFRTFFTFLLQPSQWIETFKNHV